LAGQFGSGRAACGTPLAFHTRRAAQGGRKTKQPDSRAKGPPPMSTTFGNRGVLLGLMMFTLTTLTGGAASAYEPRRVDQQLATSLRWIEDAQHATPRAAHE